MLRRALIAASTSERLRRLAVSSRPSRAVARRFVAGERLDEALAVTRELNDRGMQVTLDLLGESVADAAVAEAAAAAYHAALAAFADQGLDASVSVKPTQLGIAIDAELCHDLIVGICVAAAAVGTHVTIDMEGSDLTATTVALVLRLRSEGHRNVGCAVQAYLHRTAADIAALTADGASLRLCKGAYAEPDALALQGRDEIRQSYLRLAEDLLRSGTFARFATHDDYLIDRMRNLARRLEVDPDAYEFQMLYGVREPLQAQLVSSGERVRIYVPFGDQWYPYLVRRLAERPANLGFFLRALVGRRGGTR